MHNNQNPRIPGDWQLQLEASLHTSSRFSFGQPLGFFYRLMAALVERLEAGWWWPRRYEHALLGV